MAITEAPHKMWFSLSVLLLSVACTFIKFTGMANAAETVVSGTISLPSRVTPYNTEKLIRISLMTGKVGPNFQHLFQCPSVVLPANQKSIPYECRWPESAGLTGEFGIYVDTISSLPNYYDPDMPGIFHSAYYNSAGSKADAQEGELFDTGGTYSDKDITLIPTLTVKLVMQTPSHESFDVDQELIVDLLGNVTSDAEGIRWTYSQGGDIKWLAGSDQLEVTFEVLDFIDGDFILWYRFAEGFGLGFLEEGYYSKTGSVPTIEQATILSSYTSKLDLNMILSNLAPSNGTSNLHSMLHLLLFND